jgi:hypothetical protein
MNLSEMKKTSQPIGAVFHPTNGLPATHPPTPFLPVGKQVLDEAIRENDHKTMK